MENDLLQSVIEEPPAKPARVSNHAKQQEKQRVLSMGYALNSNTNFYDIPASDAFNELLERYLPPQERSQRDVADTDKQKGLETMVMNNMWRSIAKYARQQIVQTDPTQVEYILHLWYVRLLALTKLGLCQLASAEFEKIGNLDRPELCDHNQQPLAPFELRVLFATLPSHLKYPALAIERITMLAVYCKKMQKKSRDDIWKQREIQTYLVLATHWINMRDYSAASITMQLILTTKATDNADILSSLGRLYLQMGDLKSAQTMFRRMEEQLSNTDTAKEAINTNKAFALMAQGEWVQARDILQRLYQSNNENLLAINNLAVCEVYLGKLIKAIEILEVLISNNPTSAGTCETAIMNLCTLYELRFEDATVKKIEVMKQVARWAGDSFQADCIKLQ
ncbi:hypothetical protein [Parasitella parasitica]|uniref:Uncharacterized protein n=1 Tax=Parasitella parasitica TaxID=35722 RepID=A0A0B7NRX6_9FUNG|nr:hypothetical protein [Parasitella parasitica]